jgi:hypothetical protein
MPSDTERMRTRLWQIEATLGLLGGATGDSIASIMCSLAMLSPEGLRAVRAAAIADLERWRVRNAAHLEFDDRAAARKRAGQPHVARFQVGEWVIKDPETWVSDPDAPGEGEGAGVIVAVGSAPADAADSGYDVIDVRWPSGRARRRADQLMRAPLIPAADGAVSIDRPTDLAPGESCWQVHGFSDGRVVAVGWARGRLPESWGLHTGAPGGEAPGGRVVRGGWYDRGESTLPGPGRDG